MTRRIYTRVTDAMLEAAADAIEDATGALPAEDIGSQLAPRRPMTTRTNRRAGSEVPGCRAIQAVDPAGIEPATSTLQTARWASDDVR